MISSIPKPPHRLERLQHWMAAEAIDCTIALGADNVNHLCGYWRYFGGPPRSSSAPTASGPDRHAGRGADRDARIRMPTRCSATGSAASGSTSTRSPTSSSAVTAVPAVARARRIGVASELPTAVERIGASASGAIVGADAALHRIRLIKDWDELEKVNAAYELCWLGQEAVSRRRRAGHERDRAVHGGAVGGADRVRADRSSSSATSCQARTPPRCAARSTLPGGAPWRRATQ